MRKIFAILILVLAASSAWADDCEFHLAGILKRGPFQLDLLRSELRWAGDNEKIHTINVSPRQLEVLHSVFWAGFGLKEFEKIPTKTAIANHALLFPNSDFNPRNIHFYIGQISEKIFDEDPDQSYDIMSGQYRDILIFTWNENAIQVPEDYYTLLSYLEANPNRKIGFAELLDVLRKSLPRWQTISRPEERVSHLMWKVRKRFPHFPIEARRGGLRWANRDLSQKIQFRGFTLDIDLHRLSWKEGERIFDIRLKPIEAAVIHERILRGDVPIKWDKVAEGPLVERLKTASVVALKVHFSNTRRKVLELSPAAAEKLTIY